MVYLVDMFGILGSGQSPRFTVSEKWRERGNTTHSQWEKLINKDQRHTSHMWTQNLL